MIINNAKIYLCRPDRDIICELNGKQISSVNYEVNLKDYNKITFNVDRYINIEETRVESNGYDKISDHMVLYLEGLDYFQIQEPSVFNDGKYEYKSVTAYSDEKSFEDKDLKGLLFNKGTEDSLEMLATNNVDEMGFAKEYITFCNDKNHELSLMHLVLDKVPGWTVGYIDPALKDQKYSFEADNTNVYAFLVGTVAPVVKCIFEFDTINRTVNAYYREYIGLDSNIFIGFRNLQNSVKMQVNEGNIRNVLTVQGDDSLNIRTVNFGQSQIYNLDYYLNTKYFKQETIDKVQAWLAYREEKREGYVNLAKQEADLQKKIDDIMYRVPNDGCTWEQWDGMTEELLQKNLKYYKKLLETLQVSVDTRDDYEKDADGNYIKYDNPDDLQNRVYKPWLTSDGAVDHKKYMDLLYDQANGYGGYYTYLEVKEYIIPNIEIAIENINVPEEDKKDYNKEFETNWDLYGISELEGKRDGYSKEILEVLKNYSKDWDELTDDEKANIGFTEDYYKLKHKRYLEYKGYLGDENTAGSLLYKLKQLNDEVTELQKRQSDIQSQMTELQGDTALDNEQFGLTEKEYIAVNNIFIMGDYTNSNIFVSSVDDAVSAFNAALELFEDGMEKIAETSQPQYSIETELDNLLSIAEYVDINETQNSQSWYEKFKVGNFIRVGIRDDYAVKVRLLSFSYNPCTKTSDINVTYTNMINGRTGRNDFADLFDDAIADTKNSISVGTGNAKDSVEYMTNMLNMLTQSQLFGNAVGNSVNNVINNSSVVESIIGNYAQYQTIRVDKIIGNDGEFETLFSKYIDSEYINSHFIIGDNAQFKELATNLAKINQAIIGTSSTETGIIFNLSAQNAKIDEAWVAQMVVGKLSVADLAAGDITLSDKMRILSENGNLVINGNTMQFLNPNGEVGIQIGYGTSENPSIIIKDENGTALWTSQGVTKDAIADGLIVNDMLENGTVGKEKLGFSIVEPNEYGGIDIGQIYLGDGGKFGVEYTEFKNNTSEQFENIGNAIDSLSDASDSIELIGSQVFTVTDSVISPTSITVTAQCKNKAVVAKWFIDDVENSSFVSQDNSSIIIPNTYMQDKKKIDIKAQNADGTIYDIFSIYKVADGQDGEDAISVQLVSSEGQIFKDGDSIPNHSEISCNVFRGGTAVQPNSYQWFVKIDESDWQEIEGNTQTVNLNLDDFVVKMKIKCKVDI